MPLAFVSSKTVLTPGLLHHMISLNFDLGEQFFCFEVVAAVGC
jgi:hypothetical protein